MQPQQKFNGSGPGATGQSGAIVCAQCGSPMPPEMRFCRACGNRLGEGPAEYTETVRLPHGKGAPDARFSAQYAPGMGGPIAQPAAGGLRRKRRLGFTGMTWMWIVLGVFFASGGFMSLLFQRGGSGRRPAFTVPVSRSYLGVNGLKSADGGVTFDDSAPPGGPADKAGLVGGDIITSFDGHPVQSDGEVINLLRQIPIGKTVEVIYTRDGDFHNTQVTTISKEALDQLNESFSRRSDGQGRFGFDDGDAETVPIPGTKISGVKLGDVSANLPADIAGIKEGDIVIEFDNVPIRTPEELTYRVKRVVPYSTVKVVVMRNGQRLEIPVKLGKR